MKSILNILTFLLCGNAMFAQNVQYISDGTIEFEKSVNMWALQRNYIVKGSPNEIRQQQNYEAYRAGMPQFLIGKSSLSFSKDKTLFAPSIQQEAPRTAPIMLSGGMMMMAPTMSTTYPGATSQTNTIYTDLTTKTSTVDKKVFEETFLVKDAPRKITSETREIAGYFCRRANAVIMDSTYVVAFYTDDIPVSGGPESFTGLPGMILQVVLPHENITWIATKVTASATPPANIKVPAPAKAKIVSNKELRETLESSFKSRYSAVALQNLLKFCLL